MKFKSAFTLCAILRELLARSRKNSQLLTTIIKGQEQIMSKADEIKAIQEQDLAEGRETAAAGQAAIARLTAAVTALTDKVAALETNTVTDEQVAEIKAASDAAKEISDAVQAAFDQAGA
jgi:uncharacterized coiled-coil protein SlyX